MNLTPLEAIRVILLALGADSEQIDFVQACIHEYTRMTVIRDRAASAQRRHTRKKAAEKKGKL